MCLWKSRERGTCNIDLTRGQSASLQRALLRTKRKRDHTSGIFSPRLFYSPGVWTGHSLVVSTWSHSVSYWRCLAGCSQLMHWPRRPNPEPLVLCKPPWNEQTCIFYFFFQCSLWRRGCDWIESCVKRCPLSNGRWRTGIAKSMDLYTLHPTCWINPGKCRGHQGCVIMSAALASKQTGPDGVPSLLYLKLCWGFFNWESNACDKPPSPHHFVTFLLFSTWWMMAWWNSFNISIFKKCLDPLKVQPDLLIPRIGLNTFFKGILFCIHTLPAGTLWSMLSCVKVPGWRSPREALEQDVPRPGPSSPCPRGHLDSLLSNIGQQIQAFADLLTQGSHPGTGHMYWLLIGIKLRRKHI